MNVSFSTADILRPDVINLDLEGRIASEVIAELHRELSRCEAVNDPRRFLAELLARQLLGGNCIDREIALPHVRTQSVDRIVLGVGRSASGVSFDSDHPAVRLIFLIGVPAGATAEYLRWVSMLARRLRTPSVRQALLGAISLNEFNEVWANTS